MLGIAVYHNGSYFLSYYLGRVYVLGALWYST